jgi:NSS family neurotransmitter:Na+ symporter
MGTMITYGSYFPKKQSLPVAGISVALADTFVAILAGLIIFPALFSAGGQIQGGPGLVFVVLPTVFAAMPFGYFFGVLFFTCLVIAALTSTISLLEVVVAYFVDERGWKRHKAATVVATACLALAVPSALSQGGGAWFTEVGWLDIQNIIWGNYALSIGAIFICVFAGWRWGTDKLLQYVEMGGNVLPGRAVLGVVVKYIAPLAIAAVLGFIIVTRQYF